MIDTSNFVYIATTADTKGQELEYAYGGCSLP